MTALSEAKAAVEAARTKLAEAEARWTTAKDAEARGVATRARLRYPLALRRVSGDVELWYTTDLGLGWGAPKEPKATRKALLDGSLSLAIGGTTPKLTTLVRRLRRYGKRQARLLASLDRRIAELQRQRVALIRGAFDAGTPVTATELADLVLRLRASRTESPVGMEYTVQLAQRVLDSRTRHLEAVRSRTLDTCECDVCSATRQRAKEDAEAKIKAAAKALADKLEAKRRAKLPRAAVALPEHSDRDGQPCTGKAVALDLDESSDNPRVWCVGCWKYASHTALLETRSVPEQTRHVLTRRVAALRKARLAAAEAGDTPAEEGVA